MNMYFKDLFFLKRDHTYIPTPEEAMLLEMMTEESFIKEGMLDISKKDFSIYIVITGIILGLLGGALCGALSHSSPGDFFAMEVSGAAIGTSIGFIVCMVLNCCRPKYIDYRAKEILKCAAKEAASYESEPLNPEKFKKLKGKLDRIIATRMERMIAEANTSEYLNLANARARLCELEFIPKP